MWSSRNTPNDWTKLWSSCVRHVQMDIMLPLPTSDARTSISAKREKKPWVSLSSFKGFYRLFFASKRKIHVKRVEDITLVRDFQLFDVDYIFFRWLVGLESDFSLVTFHALLLSSLDSLLSFLSLLPHTPHQRPGAMPSCYAQRLHLDGSWISIFQSLHSRPQRKLFFL